MCCGWDSKCLEPLSTISVISWPLAVSFIGVVQNVPRENHRLVAGPLTNAIT